MAWTDIVKCYRTTDGKIFDDPDEAMAHQDKLDVDQYLIDFNEAMKPVIDEALSPLKKYVESTNEQ